MLEGHETDIEIVLQGWNQSPTKERGNADEQEEMWVKMSYECGSVFASFSHTTTVKGVHHGDSCCWHSSLFRSAKRGVLLETIGSIVIFVVDSVFK